MSGLKALQESFQRGVLAGDDTILGEIKGSAKESRDVLFGVYRNAYVLRLIEVLTDDYEQLHAYLGDAGFAKLARAYIDAHPSDRRSARDFGRHMPRFLRHADTHAKHPELAEIAELEKALGDAFDGPDAEPLSLEHLAAIAPQDWPRLVFEPHPTAIRLTFTTNAADLWSALHGEARPPKPRHLEEREAVIVWRQEFMARFRPLPPEEAMMWDETAKGVAFGALCEMVATFAGTYGAELRAASYLKGWVDMGMLTNCRIG
ncbi:MAG: putative DNA-binding domain-containing protein [Methyloceanibacter sp.]